LGFPQVGKVKMDLDTSIDRILKVIDTKINKLYDYDEPSVCIVAKTYIKKYISFGNYSRSQLKLLCATCYLLAMKYQLDDQPLIKEYSEIVNVSTKNLVDKEMDLALKFLFNFTPR